MASVVDLPLTNPYWRMFILGLVSSISLVQITTLSSPFPSTGKRLIGL